MTAEGAERGVGLTEHLYQSLVYHLRTQTIPVYDNATGQHVSLTLPQAMPGILIRGPKTTYRGIPELDIRDSEVEHPYLIVFHRPVGPISEEMYGGGYAEPSLWEINVRMGERTLFDYLSVSDWIKGFLIRKHTLDIYHYRYSGGSPTRSDDIIARAHISDVILEDNIDVALSRGDDGWIVANFTITVYHAMEE
jgi:hypothetical protein